MTTIPTNTPAPLFAANAAVTPALPTLNEATILRAREGLAASRDHAARLGVRASLANGELIAEGKADQRIPGVARRTLLRMLVNSLFDIRVEHPENIPSGPVMLAPNHLNHIDPFVVLAQMPPTPYYYILGDARTLYNKTWKRALIRYVGGVIPLDRIWKEEQAVIRAAQDGRPELAELAAALQRETPDGSSLDALHQIDRIVQAIFARGDAILIFPEGGLGTTEGQLRPLKRGAVIYAMRANVPIVPVGVIGTRDLFLRKRLTIRFGKPLRFGQDSHSKRATVEALETLRQAMQDLIPRDYQEPEGAKPLRHLLNHMFW
jgi:1-acyl-sn-glycerol-3-phosphate acyltransferase